MAAKRKRKPDTKNDENIFNSPTSWKNFPTLFIRSNSKDGKKPETKKDEG